jgi:hypothetical protein
MLGRPLPVHNYGRFERECPVVHPERLRRELEFEAVGAREDDRDVIRLERSRERRESDAASSLHPVISRSGIEMGLLSHATDRTGLIFTLVAETKRPNTTDIKPDSVVAGSNERVELCDRDERLGFTAIPDVEVIGRRSRCGRYNHFC